MGPGARTLLERLAVVVWAKSGAPAYIVCTNEQIQARARGDRARRRGRHRREARPVWWWFFERQQMTVDELVDDADSIGRLAPVGRPRPDKQSMLHQRVETVARRAGQPRDHRGRHAYSSSGLQPTRSAHTDAAS